MPLPWPPFWQHIREDDRAALSDVLTQLLSSGALLGDSGRDRELFLLARQYQREIGEYFAPLHLELVPDPDLPIFQLRPIPGDCGLVARFNKAETLLVLTLWRIYHDVILGDRAFDSVRVEGMLQRVAEQADRLEQIHLPGQDSPLDKFAGKLHQEGRGGHD